MKKAFCLLLFLCVFILKVFSQSFYVSAGYYNNSNVYRVTSTQTSYITTLLDKGVNNDTFFSIAVQGNILYYINSNQSELVKAEISGNKLINYETILPMGVAGNALTIGKNGVLFWVFGNILYKYDPALQKMILLGDMPYAASGDLMFYKDELYMATGYGIAKVDLSDLSKTSIYLPLQIDNLYGLASIAVSPTQNKYFALSSIFTSTNIWELDIDNKTVKGIVGNIPYDALDAASEVEDGTFTAIEVNKIKQFSDCNNQGKGLIKVITKPHSAIYTYTLNGTLSNNTGVFTNLNPGTFNLKISSPYEDKTMSFNVDKFTSAKPITTIGKQNLSCDVGGQISLTLNGNGDIYKIKYGNDISLANTKVWSNLPAGNYHFDILNELDCVVDSYDIPLTREKCTIKFDKLDVQQQCDAIKKGTITVITKPHTDTYTYSLNTTTNATGVFTNLLSGDYTIKVKSAEDEITLPVIVPDYGLTEPAVKYLATNPFCAEKGSIKFNLTPGYQVKYNNTTFAYDHNFTNLEVGAYSFTILKPTGCVSDQVSINLVYEPCPIEINTATVTQECNVLGKGVIQVTGKPIPEQYTYFLNSGNSNHTGVFNMLEPGNYIVKVTASGGNTPKEVPLNVPDYNLTKPKFLVTAKKALCDIPGNIRLRVTTNPDLYNIEYKSSIYPFDYTFTDLNPGVYDFKILKKDGCIAEVVNFKLERESCNPVTFPNTFTPNGDGVNDIFEPNEGSRAINYQLYIYNRYGSLLYISKDLYSGWDGKMQGNSMPAGTYYWTVNYVDDTGKKIVQKGFIALIR